MAHRDDNEIIAKTHNTARYFTENRHISWVLLVGVLIWGAFSWINMPKRKDPNIPVLVAVAVCTWPGADAEEVEQLVTKPIEEMIAQNSYLHTPEGGNQFMIKSYTLPGVSIVQFQLSEGLKDTTEQFNDINLRLDYLNNSLPEGAGPIQFNSGFGNTAAMMLTIASPKESEVQLEIRARNIRAAVEEVRSSLHEGGEARRATFVIALPGSVNTDSLRNMFDLLFVSLVEDGVAEDARYIEGPSFVGLDVGLSGVSDEEFLAYTSAFSKQMLGFSGFHVDAWKPMLITDPNDTLTKLQAVDGDKYSYRELDNITQLMTQSIQTIDQVSIVTRQGVLNQRIYLEYSQDVLASYGIVPAKIQQALSGRNINLPGGQLEAGGTEVVVYPSGLFKSIDEIGNVIVTQTTDGTPVYLRDLGQIVRGYESPPQALNYYGWRDDTGKWHRNRAITLAVQMHDGQQIGQFGAALDNIMSEIRPLLPSDLIIAKTSDQPRQVSENLDLFIRALIEAVVLVIIVAWIGFREWRSALLLSVSIPLTLSMTFGFMYLLGIDLQQVSIASLIIALGLLVDDPVVADDAIKSNLAIGHPPIISAWLGPTKLARAIMFATLTNIVAYLPYLLLTGTTGEFIYSLPIVMTCALVASRIVSMTFVPLLGYYLLKPKAKELTIEEKRKQGFTGFYYKITSYAIDHRKKVFVFSLIFFVIGGLVASRLKTSFFPLDVQYLSYVDVWLPNDATLAATNDVTKKAESIIEQVSAQYAKDNKQKSVLKSVTSFVGVGAPRFWSTVSPEQQQKNYAQIVIELENKDDTPKIAPLFQAALASQIPGAYLEMRQIQLNAVDYPIQIHIMDMADYEYTQDVEARQVKALRELAGKLEDILRKVPETAYVRDDWFEESFVVKLEVDSDRANLSGITNKDVAVSAATGLSGAQLTTFIEGDRSIPVAARLRIEERAELSDLNSMYVYGTTNNAKVPLLELSNLTHDLENSRIRRLNHFRTISVLAFPAPGELPSTILKKAEKEINSFIDSLPPGYAVVWAGEKAKQQQGFRNLSMVLLISITAIFLALVLQFSNAVKPFLVFAAVPYGVVGSLLALSIMREPFGFMAYLGIASLVGVIVSHVIVLFDFIEEMHAKGEPFVDSLLDAGIERLRPVMITVGATILALFPLAIEGGPLWQPLCYAQIGGLALATVIELLLVPVFYSIFVLDLKIIKWSKQN